MNVDLKKYIRNIEDFPKPGIIYRDITPLLLAPEALDTSLHLFLDELGDLQIDKVVGIESRGFFFAGLLAHSLNVGLVPIRKAGKLPFKTLREDYELEYGTGALEVHADSILEGEKVLIHDDVLATGGTASAAARLVERMGGEVVQFNFILELMDLKGREILKEHDVFSLLKY